MSRHINLIRSLDVSIFFITLMTITSFANAQQPGDPNKLGFFTEVPKEVTGAHCLGLFTPRSISAETKNYVFVTNIEKFALIKVDGKTVKLALAQKALPVKKSVKRIFSGSGYKAVLTTRDVSKRNEQGMEAGTLEITHDRFKVVIKVHGKASCN